MVTVLLIFSAIACLALGSLIAFQDTKRIANILFVAICACFGIWALAVLFFLQAQTADSALIAAKTFYIVAGLFPALLLIFALIFPTQENKISLPTFGLIGLTGLAVCTLIVIYPGFVIRDVVIDPAGNNGIIDPTTYTLYSAYFVALFTAAIIVALRKFSIYSGSRRMQAVLYAIGILINSIPGFIANLYLPYLGNYHYIWVGPAASIFFLSLTAYAIVRHGLFSIKLAAVRSTAYLFTLLALSVLYYAFAYVVSLVLFKGQSSAAVSVGPINIILALILAFLFQPIKRFFDRVTNKLFYKDDYNAEEFFARLTKRLSIITNLDVLLRYSSSEITSTLKATFGAFYIHRLGHPPVYVSTNESKKIPAQDIQQLDAYVTENRSEIIITKDLIDRNVRGLRRMLGSHHIALILPITKDSIITGYLFLGEHLSSQYTVRDIRALLTIAGELVIAIQNALSVQEIRSLNESLLHRVEVATKELRSSNAMLRRLDKSKDDFISMASHQLRTPLTSIKGYISMVREGDVGKITPAQDKMLEEAFTSSERMVHLISDFLNVSRLQTGRFLIEKRPVNLAKIIEQELDSLVTNAKSRELTFSYRPPKNFPELNLDEEKMRQVIMNFSDNAIYYSTEGSKIKVKLTHTAKEATFTVVDTGIGVPQAEQSQLFTRFYRASNARKQRPDGTGVGLYLAKKVIDAHDGTLIFESTEGKGSTFGFRLPLDKLRVRSDAHNLDNQDNKS